jgi:hypothetical protein
MQRLGQVNMHAAGPRRISKRNRRPYVRNGLDCDLSGNVANGWKAVGVDGSQRHRNVPR